MTPESARGRAPDTPNADDSILRHGGDKGMLALRRNPSGYTGSIRMGAHVS